MRISRERWAFSVRRAATAGSEEPTAPARRSMAAPSTPSSEKSSWEPVSPERSVAASACCMAREKRPPRVWASSSRRGSGTIWALAMVPMSRVVADWSWRSWATQVPGLSVSLPASRRARLRSSTTSTWLLCSGVRPASERVSDSWSAAVWSSSTASARAALLLVDPDCAATMARSATVR